MFAHLKGTDVFHEQEGGTTRLELLHRTRRDLVHELAKHHSVLQYLCVKQSMEADAVELSRYFSQYLS